MAVDYQRYTENLRVQVRDGILTLTLHNPEMNTNTEAMHWALSRIWDDIDGDDDVNVVVFTGAGERAFSAGGDPAHMQEMARDFDRYWYRTAREAKRIVFNMLECDKPIIARLNGHAVGFGCTLALASDLIVGVEGAKIGDPHVHSGLVCGDGGAVLWPQQLGYARAKEFLFTGKLVRMEEAAEIGLINYAVPREQLDDRVNELAQAIAGGAGRAIQLTKQVMNVALRQAAHAAMDLGMANEMLSVRTADHAEATQAFIDKRDPKPSGPR